MRGEVLISVNIPISHFPLSLTDSALTGFPTFGTLSQILSFFWRLTYTPLLSKEPICVQFPLKQLKKCLQLNEEEQGQPFP